jgi:hypothetical protein
MIWWVVGIGAGLLFGYWGWVFLGVLVVGSAIQTWQQL